MRQEKTKSVQKKSISTQYKHNMQKYIDLPFKIAKKNPKCFAVVSESDMYWGNKQTNKPWSNTQKHNVWQYSNILKANQIEAE